MQSVGFGSVSVANEDSSSLLPIVALRGPPDMMSASEGGHGHERGHGIADIVREVT